jgi:hypothetical protein
MIEVFRYTLSGTIEDITIVAPRMATRGFIEASRGEIVKGSGRSVDENLLGGGDRVVQGFTGEQVSYLRDLISLGPIATSADTRKRPWISQLTESRLIRQTEADGGIEYDITPLGRAAVAQLF